MLRLTLALSILFAALFAIANPTPTKAAPDQPMATQSLYASTGAHTLTNVTWNNSDTWPGWNVRVNNANGFVGCAHVHPSRSSNRNLTNGSVNVTRVATMNQNGILMQGGVSYQFIWRWTC